MHFSITRILLAATAFAIVVGAMRPSGVDEIVLSAVIGSSVGGIWLVVKRNQIWPMIRTGLLVIVGGLVGFSFCPMVHPPYQPGDEIGNTAVGCLVGFLLGGSITASQLSKPDNPAEKNREKSE